jgi:hypothetical protein
MRYDVHEPKGSPGGIAVMKVGLPAIVLVVVAAFAGGVVGSRLVEREAKAQSAGAAVYVPPEGLSFRSPDGRLIARLAYDSRGGFFEVYDRRERPSAALRSGFEVPARPAGLPSPAPIATVPPLATTDAPDLGY